VGEVFLVGVIALGKFFVGMLVLGKIILVWMISTI